MQNHICSAVYEKNSVAIQCHWPMTNPVYPGALAKNNHSEPAMTGIFTTWAHGGPDA